MGKQKDFRHVHNVSQKKKDKKIDKTSKPSRSSCHEGYLKSVEGVVQAELESITNTKKICRKVRKEVERFPLLTKAVYLGCERVVDNILEAGENVNVQVQGDKTPLIIAVENGYPGIVQKLLKKGADPKLLRQDGRNALMIAVANNDNRSFTLIWNYWDKSNLCELNHSDTRGFTVLTIAAENGHSQFTNFLLSLNGIEIDKQTKDGRTPLMFAVVGGQTKTVQKFLSSGSDITLEDKDGGTAVCLAITQNDAEIKSLLIESLDSKARDIYVKKRIELLSRPRTGENLEAISFYKDILFRVILEIRRSFEEGVALLEKYKVFVGLFKCLKKHQQDTDLLKCGFHLAVCIMYDKAEYSRYIVEELAEQYISAKGPDFALKMMNIYRLKSLSDLRGAAFLTIHAGTQCKTGKLWLRANYTQILPFLKEFKIIFPTLTFWADGESIKARIMFDRFEEFLNSLQKDIKDAQLSHSGVSYGTVGAVISATQMVKRNRSISNASVQSTSSDQEWSVVSNSKSSYSKSTSKNPRNQALKKETNRKSKGPKLQNKLQRKLAVRKLTTRPNSKCMPDFSSCFPALPTEIKFSETGYADALKKNLQVEDSVQSTKKKERCPKDSGNSSSKSLSSSAVSSSSWVSKTSIGETEEKENPKLEDPWNKANPIDQETKLGELDKVDNEKMQDFWNLWSKATHVKDRFNVMASYINTFMSNSSKNEMCDKRIQPGKTEPSVSFLPAEVKEEDLNDWELLSSEISVEICKKETTELSVNASTDATVVKDCYQEHHDKKPLCETFASLGLKVPSDQNDYNETVKVTSNEIALAEIHRTSSPKNDIDDEIPDLEIKESLAEKNPREIDGEEDPIIDQEIDLNSTFESETSFDFNCSKSSSEKDTVFFASDNTCMENLNTDYSRNYKRKYKETCLRDLSFNFYTEEVKEIGKVLVPSESKSNRQYDEDMSKLIQCQNDHRSALYALTKSKVNGIRCLKPNKNNYDSLDLKSTCCTEIRKKSTTSEGKTDRRFQTMLPTRESELRISCMTEKTKDSKELDEKKNTTKLMTDEIFSDFNLKSCKRKPNLKNLLLSFNITDVTPKLKSISIQKYIIMYQRLILYKLPLLSGMLSKGMPPQSESSLVSSGGKKNEKESKNLIRFPNYTTGIGKLNEDSSLLIPQKDYGTPFSQKLKLVRYYQTVLLHATSRFSINSLRRRGIRVTKIMDKEKRRSSKFSKPLSSNYKNIENSYDHSKFNFNSYLYGCKSHFINCEYSSRWYRTLRMIETCVPVASILMNFKETERSPKTDCTLHEIICSSGKIVFSTKDEHTLRTGESGTYIGLMNNGNPVVVKRFERTLLGAVELLSKKRRVTHRNMVAFYCVCTSPTDQSLFAVTELLEYSLPEYLKANIYPFDAKTLVRELVEAIRYLHKREIVHGFLKPSNVMVTIDNRLKVSDFYWLDVSPLKYGIKVMEEKEAPSSIGQSLSDLCWRPYELIVAATATEARKYLTAASDIQMAGMLIYYILSQGQHPFGSTDLQCIENIRDGFPKFGPKPTDIESRDLIRDMIKRVPPSRPVINLVAKHPYLWDNDIRFRFLLAVSRKIEFFARKPTKIAESLQDSCIEARDWTSYVHYRLLKYMGQSTNKTYGNNLLDLLLFLVALNDSFEVMPSELKLIVQQPSFFIFRTFPLLFMSVYSVLRNNPCVQRQMALQAYF